MALMRQIFEIWDYSDQICWDKNKLFICEYRVTTIYYTPLAELRNTHQHHFQPISLFEIKGHKINEYNKECWCTVSATDVKKLIPPLIKPLDGNLDL